jgi:hypothetical protein
MELNLGERFALIPILPQKGSYITLERAGELRKRLVPTESETAKLKITDVVDAEGVPTGDLEWPREYALVEAEIEIGETMNDAIKAKLEALSEAGELLLGHMTLYEKFVKAAEPVAAEKP